MMRPFVSTLLALLLFATAAGAADGFRILASATQSVATSPAGGVVFDRAGNLYGLSQGGGAFGFGSVYKLTPGGVLSTFYSFAPQDGGITDGSQRLAIDASGNLYGTTLYGGANDDGMVFKLSPGRVFTVLHAFDGTDGQNPEFGVTIDAQGTLHGTTMYGGPTDSGMIFAITAAGAFSSIPTPAPEGFVPSSGLTVDSAGNLYGATYNENEGASAGTIFKIAPDGSATTLVNFEGDLGSIGSPLGNLAIDGSGNLYGSTHADDLGFGPPQTAGTNFQVSPAGAVTILRAYTARFEETSITAEFPTGGLTLGPDGSLFGTTSFDLGGAVLSGRLFRITPEGSYETLHIFLSAQEDYPLDGLTLDSSGNLYGTTTGGGLQSLGAVYKLTGADR